MYNPRPDTTALTLAELLSMDGRVAVVTGAAQGIGLACAERLAEAGAAVFLGDINIAGAEASAEAIRAKGGTALGGLLDISDPASVKQAFALVREKLGAVDTLVNNAGIYPPSLLDDLDIAGWQRVLRINLDGALLCSQELAAGLPEGSAGAIVNVTSTAGYRAETTGMAAYIASKHGLNGLTKAMAVEYGARGIRAMAVAPTLIETPGLTALAAGADVSERAKQMAGLLPLGRIGTPDDIAKAVLFCVTDFANFVTGSTVFVDGGTMAKG